MSGLAAADGNLERTRNQVTRLVLRVPRLEGGVALGLIGC